MIYRFGPFTLDTDAIRLTGDGGPEIAVEPQVFSLIQLLIENRERVVTKDEIIEAVWDGRIVSDGTLNSRINAARRALGDDGKAQAVIKTFPRRGFRFVAELTAGATEIVTKSPFILITDKPSIAVLPLHNLSGDPDQDYIGDALSEDITAGLSRTRAFLLISRNSTLHYRESLPDVRKIAAELRARYVIEGSVRRAENRIRVSLQLTDGESGSHIWAQRYDREFEDLFVLQDEITQTIVAQLAPELRRAEFERARTQPTENLDAWALYHRGIYAYNRWNSEMVRVGIGYMERAAQLDPEFAPAHAMLAMLKIQDRTQFGADVSLEGVVDLGKKAVELDSNDPLSHLALGMAYFFSQDVEAAVASLETALQLDPSSASAYQHLGASLMISGRAEEAMPLLELSIRLSPADYSLGGHRGRVARCHLYLGNYEKAVEIARRALQQRVIWPARSVLACALAHLGRVTEAKSVVEQMSSAQPEMSIKFIEERTPLVHQPYKDILLDGLRKAGVPEE